MTAVTTTHQHGIQLSLSAQMAAGTPSMGTSSYPGTAGSCSSMPTGCLQRLLRPSAGTAEQDASPTLSRSAPAFLAPPQHLPRCVLGDLDASDCCCLYYFSGSVSPALPIQVQCYLLS